MDTEKIKDSLEEVLAICEDGEEGYQTASEKIKIGEFSTLFLRFSQQRKLFQEELKNEGLKMGLDLKVSGSVKGFFHRTWLATKALVADNTEENVIADAMEGEKQALRVYESALAKSQLPAYIKDMLQEQQRLIKVAIQQLQGLKQEL
ncbi:ferritin-like domain-containing protein [Pleomorphovibrio marinus]|uniref:ferritin-like domain-containing protein n=1 Tax=Pleomorphovibrio marinus TaxID=2164132 RepID=UPI000E0A8F6E|nr:PA2169 family four-helix-bundle protein [Pleomorphovibrio marinus]